MFEQLHWTINSMLIFWQLHSQVLIDLFIALEVALILADVIIATNVLLRDVEELQNISLVVLLFREKFFQKQLQFLLEFGQVQPVHLNFLLQRKSTANDVQLQQILTAIIVGGYHLTWRLPLPLRRLKQWQFQTGDLFVKRISQALELETISHQFGRNYLKDDLNLTVVDRNEGNQIGEVRWPYRLSHDLLAHQVSSIG